MRLWTGWMVMAICFLSLHTGCSTAPDPAEVIGGTFVGYTYSEQPVIDTEVEVEYGYTLTFKAYDLGGETRFVVYAQRKSTGDYYIGVIRLNIEDPDGNAYTFYHNTEADAIDKPIMWTRRTAGDHNVTIEFNLYLDEFARAGFDVPLVREPVSGLLVAGIGLALLIGVVVVVLVIRRR